MKGITVLIIGLLIVAGCHRDQKKTPKNTTKPTETVTKTQKTKTATPKKAAEKQKTPENLEKTGFDAVFDALDELCAIIPNPTDAMFFIPAQEASRVIHTMATGMVMLTGQRGARRFFAMVNQRFGLKGLDKVKQALVIVSNGQVFLFLKGAAVDTSNRETYHSQDLNFAVSRTKPPVLSGKYKGWVVVGARNPLLRLVSIMPKNPAPRCKRLKKMVTEALGPNMNRDPFKTGVGFVLSVRTTIFWDSTKGVRVLLPLENNHKSLKKLKVLISNWKNNFANRLSEAEAGAPVLHPMTLKSAASQITITSKDYTRGQTFVWEARGNVVNFFLAIYQDKLRPFLGRKPRKTK